MSNSIKERITWLDELRSIQTVPTCLMIQGIHKTQIFSLSSNRSSVCLWVVYMQLASPKFVMYHQLRQHFAVHIEKKLFLSYLTLWRRKLISVAHKYSFLTSQRTQFAFIIKMNQLMLHREIAAVYCDNHKEHTYTCKVYFLCCENSEMF